MKTLGSVKRSRLFSFDMGRMGRGGGGGGGVPNAFSADQLAGPTQCMPEFNQQRCCRSVLV